MCRVSALTVPCLLRSINGASAVPGWAGGAHRISDCNLAKGRFSRVASGEYLPCRWQHLLLYAPVVFPWYFLSLLPFLTSASTLLIIIWTVSIIPAYVQWHLRTLGRPWGALPGWVMLLEYGCVLIVRDFRFAPDRPMGGLQCLADL